MGPTRGIDSRTHLLKPMMSQLPKMSQLGRNMQYKIKVYYYYYYYYYYIIILILLLYFYYYYIIIIITIVIVIIIVIIIIARMDVERTYISGFTWYPKLLTLSRKSSVCCLAKDVLSS